MNRFLTIENLTFAYENSIEPLFEAVSFQVEQGWTGIVGANGSGKTTLLKLLCGLLQPDGGSLIIPGKTWYAEQRTDFEPAGLAELFSPTKKHTYKILESLQISNSWQNQWDRLSHGERKRCQIAVALNEDPDILAIDEPSNHLDGSSKKVLLSALSSYPGIGLLVSHDRELMDTLCHRTVFLFPPHIDMRKCSYSPALLEIE